MPGNSISALNYPYTNPLIGRIVFPGRKSLLPKSTIHEYPATAFPIVNYSRANYEMQVALGRLDPNTTSYKPSNIATDWDGSPIFDCNNPGVPAPYQKGSIFNRQPIYNYNQYNNYSYNQRPSWYSYMGL